MALVSGLAFIATFPILLYVSGTNNYSVPIEQFAPVFLLLGLLTLSGYMHLNKEGE